MTNDHNLITVWLNLTGFKFLRLEEKLYKLFFSQVMTKDLIGIWFLMHKKYVLN